MLADRYIYAKLSANAGVSALVGTRIYPVYIPQDAVFPAIVYTATYSPADKTKTGPATHDNCVVSIMCWAAKYDDTGSIDVAVRAALDYDDDSGKGKTAGGVTIDVCEWAGSSAGAEDGNTTGQGRYFFREATYNLRERL